MARSLSVAWIGPGWLAFTGALDSCIRCIGEVEQRLALAESEDRRWQLARVNTVRCQIACFQQDLAQAEDYAASALQDLPVTDQHYRANIHHSLGDSYRHIGRWEEAKTHYLKVLDLVEDPMFRIRSVHVYGALADLELQQGQLRNAAAFWRKALTVTEQPDTWGSLPVVSKNSIAHELRREQAQTGW